MEDKYLRLFID